MESEMARYGAEAVIKKVLTDRTPGPPCLPKETPFGSNIADIKLPTWFTEDDLKYYAQKNWELTAAWTGSKVKVPVKFVVGDVDMVYTTPGVKEYVHGGGFKNDVPLLEECVVMDNVGHFLNQEKADEVNAHIHEFIKKF
ncbi:UNVERIFIED_CONTAM: hypothetical protein Scaly_0695700 [Sesamum calycinum]|uniref:Epoxide hydrolase n=1 Tax=Sesamum calycinum TaxID=2727403 RepID=A0AAW2R773_9LAMI